MVGFFTAVALRRSISLILCITLVSYIKVYDDYFCKLIKYTTVLHGTLDKLLLNATAVSDFKKALPKKHPMQ